MQYASSFKLAIQFVKLHDGCRLTEVFSYASICYSVLQKLQYDSVVYKVVLLAYKIRVVYC